MRVARRDVNPASLKVAAHAGRLMDAGAIVRHGFARRDPDGVAAIVPGEAPPLMRMLRGGQGGEVRLKLYLSMLWFAARYPYTVRRVPAHVWARLFDLRDPDRAGAKRVYAALDWLVENGFAEAERQKGRVATMKPRHERGDAAYYRPFDTPNGGEISGELPAEDRYFTIPQSFWSRGWISVLPGTAVAVLCILLDDMTGRPGTKTRPAVSSRGLKYDRVVSLPPRYYTEENLKTRWGISYDAWSTGLAQLHEWNLASWDWKSLGDGFESRHRRRVVRINLAVLDAGPSPEASNEFAAADDLLELESDSSEDGDL